MRSKVRKFLHSRHFESEPKHFQYSGFARDHAQHFIRCQSFLKIERGKSKMEEIVIVFTLAYLLVSLCFVAPPREFVSAGLTVQNILSSYLGSEDMDFVGYHLKRTTATLLLHSLLPLGKYQLNACACLNCFSQLIFKAMW